MRAIAVLCMVEVHTAAIIPPEGVTVGSPMAFVAAAFGGMAAPMFVTISGWGMYMSAQRRRAQGFSGSDWVRWIVPRVLLLTACQVIVNLFLNVERGGRFEWQTPGVLTLLAVAAILSPILSRIPFSFRTAILLLACASPLVLGDTSGPELGWFERVGSEGIFEWLERLFVNGTYPIAPWIFYVILGTLVYDLRESPDVREKGIIMGLIATALTILISAIEEVDWALTEGDAVLTFFPASTPFLIVSGTMAVLAMRILEGSEARGGEPAFGDKLTFLEPSGRLSLTIYVSHFAVLGIAAMVLEGEPRLALAPAFLATSIHTIVWIPLAIAHEKYIPGISIEGLLRTVQSGR